MSGIFKFVCKISTKLQIPRSLIQIARTDRKNVKFDYHSRNDYFKII